MEAVPERLPKMCGVSTPEVTLMSTLDQPTLNSIPSMNYPRGSTSSQVPVMAAVIYVGLTFFQGVPERPPKMCASYQRRRCGVTASPLHPTRVGHAMSRLTRHGPAVNPISLVGSGNVRLHSPTKPKPKPKATAGPGGALPDADCCICFHPLRPLPPPRGSAGSCSARVARTKPSSYQ